MGGGESVTQLQVGLSSSFYHSSALFRGTPFIDIPVFPALLLHALTVLPGIISKINYRYLNSCLQVYFGMRGFKLRQVILVRNLLELRAYFMLSLHFAPNTMCGREGGQEKVLGWQGILVASGLISMVAMLTFFIFLTMGRSAQLGESLSGPLLLR